VCGDIYYVDQRTLAEIEAASLFDPTENPFTCDECEEEYEEDEYPR
jgi:hypothetical protein